MNDSTKSDRALQLSEQGMAPWQIAIRLGTTARSVSAMLLAAKRRRNERKKPAEVVSE